MHGTLHPRLDLVRRRADGTDVDLDPPARVVAVRIELKVPA